MARRDQTLCFPAHSLGQLGHRPESQAELASGFMIALPDLTKSLHDQDAFVRQYAAEALGKMAPDASTAIRDLAQLLGDKAIAARLAAVAALGKMGPAAEDTIPALVELLGDENEAVRKDVSFRQA